MKQAKLPKNESERLEALESYQLSDTLREKELDDITAIASQICQTPISLISLIDSKRQWFKSHHGLDATETPKEYAFCAHAILNPNEFFEVEDSTKDDRFFDNPLVTGDPHVVFYTGVPLVNEKGYALGTLCVIDNKPNKLTDEQKMSLKALANQVVKLFELRKTNIELLALKKVLEEKNESLNQFAYIVSHDLKSPLNHIVNFSGFIIEEYDNLSEDGKASITYIQEAAINLKNLIDGILQFYRADNISTLSQETVNLNDFLNSIIQILKNDSTFEFNLPKTSHQLIVNKIALEQILLNLISNGLKYNSKDTPKIWITFKESKSHYIFSVKDNGEGIADENQKNIFNLFTTLEKRDRFGNTGTGIGLATVKKNIEKLEGEIKLESKINEGSTFEFSIKK